MQRFILGGSKSKTMWYLKMQFLVDIILQEKKYF